MGHWLDAVAKASAGRRGSLRTSPPSRAAFAPGSGRPDASASAAAQQGLTRRDLIRKGTLVGVAAWSVPVLQSALAPAAAVSGLLCTQPTCGQTLPESSGPCTLCPTMATCSANADCASGACSGGYCVPSLGVCSSNQNCPTGACVGIVAGVGSCALLWPDAVCTQSSQCASGKCTGGRCTGNTVGKTCRSTVDCTDNTTCGPTKVCGGPGAPCANNNKCVSNSCVNGTCD